MTAAGVLNVYETDITPDNHQANHFTSAASPLKPAMTCFFVRLARGGRSTGLSGLQRKQSAILSSPWNKSTPPTVAKKSNRHYTWLITPRSLSYPAAPLFLFLKMCNMSWDKILFFFVVLFDYLCLLVLSFFSFHASHSRVHHQKMWQWQ